MSSEAELYRQFEDNEHKKLCQERDAIMTRKENFEREMLNLKLQSINKLAESIVNLSSSLVQQKPSTVVNIYLDKDTNSENLIKVIKELNNS